MDFKILYQKFINLPGNIWKDKFLYGGISLCTLGVGLFLYSVELGCNFPKPPENIQRIVEINKQLNTSIQLEDLLTSSFTDSVILYAQNLKTEKDSLESLPSHKQDIELHERELHKTRLKVYPSIFGGAFMAYVSIFSIGRGIKIRSIRKRKEEKI